MKDGEILQKHRGGCAATGGLPLSRHLTGSGKGRGASAILKAMVQRFQHPASRRMGRSDRRTGIDPPPGGDPGVPWWKRRRWSIRRGPSSPRFFSTGSRAICRSRAIHTAVYDLAGFSGPVTARRTSSARARTNTYLIKGLPVGPICSPGSKIHPGRPYILKRSPYLYFVSNNDGTHTFSETLKEHNLAVLRSGEKRKRRPRQGGRTRRERTTPRPEPEYRRLPRREPTARNDARPDAKVSIDPEKNAARRRQGRVGTVSSCPPSRFKKEKERMPDQRDERGGERCPCGGAGAVG